MAEPISDKTVTHQQALKDKADPITLRELVGHYLARNDYDPKTIQQYEITVRLVERWLGKRCLARDIFTDEGLARFMKYLTNSPIRFGSSNKKRSPRTVNNKRRDVCIWWNWAFRQTQRNGRNWCHVMPPDKHDVPKRFEDRPAPVAWTPGDVGEMLLNADAAPVYPTWTTRHWRCLILMAYETGWRIDSLLSLEWRNLKDNTIHCERMKRKRTDTKWISDDLCAELNALQRSDGLLIFSWPRSRQIIWDDYRHILRACGLPETRKDLFHKLRRTNATQIAKATTIDRAAAAMCHSDRRTVRESYIDPMQMPDAHIPLPRPTTISQQNATPPRDAS